MHNATAHSSSTTQQRNSALLAHSYSTTQQRNSALLALDVLLRCAIVNNVNSKTELHYA